MESNPFSTYTSSSSLGELISPSSKIEDEISTQLSILDVVDKEKLNQLVEQGIIPKELLIKNKNPKKSVKRNGISGKYKKLDDEYHKKVLERILQI
jgi:hypothetical protein